jgi:hypothetical protein
MEEKYSYHIYGTMVAWPGLQTYQRRTPKKTTTAILLSSQKHDKSRMGGRDYFSLKCNKDGVDVDKITLQYAWCQLYKYIRNLGYEESSIETKKSSTSILAGSIRSNGKITQSLSGFQIMYWGN